MSTFDLLQLDFKHGTFFFLCVAIVVFILALIGKIILPLLVICAVFYPFVIGVASSVVKSCCQTHFFLLEL